MRTLAIILGDQLDLNSRFLQRLTPKQDQLWMAELSRESTDIGSHKARVVMFLAAMRHFASSARARNWTVNYHRLGSLSPSVDFEQALTQDLKRLRPEQVQLQEPGEYRVLELIRGACQRAGVPIELHPDPHFIVTTEFFADYVSKRKTLRMEYFYRELRRREDILMDGSEPVGGKWNFDHDNRKGFPATGPTDLVAPISFPPTNQTRETISQVQSQLPDLPGSLEHFNWPLTAEDAELALDDFVEKRLHLFGQYQDAMWQNEPYLYHSRLSAALNLKLLSPRRVIDRAVSAYHDGQAPLNAVEGFVRQILGWREYVRGIYWKWMPEYLERNSLGATAALPRFYWTGATDYVCLSQTIHQTLEHGYAHHIQRLMVTGLFALLLGVDPKQIHRWYLAVYVDAVEWVELPNTLGMSQYADGGLMGSKPYVASGKYIQRMSNYCKTCRFNPALATGESACPFTTLYWSFLIQHESILRKNRRMTFQYKNLDRKSVSERDAISRAARKLKSDLEKTS